MEKKNYIPSFLVAYMLSLGGLNHMMGILLKKSDGIMIMNLVPVAAMLVLHFFISDKKNDLNMDKKALLFVYYIVSIIICYKYAMRKTTLHYEELFVYCLIPIYISFYKINVETVLKWMMVFSTLIIPFSNDFFKSVTADYETIGMSTTYNILPFVVAAAIHFIYYHKKAGFWLWLGYGINVYYLLKVILLGNRGPIISLVVFVIMVVMHRADSDGNIKKSTGRNVFITLAVGIAAILVIGNIESIILSFHKWLQSVNVELAFVTKTVRKIGSGDITNGRQELFKFVFQGIKEHYLLGNGVASITYKSFRRYSYPHNLFLQMWYDLGIIISLPLLFVVWKSIKKTVFDYIKNKDIVAMLILLFTLSIPRLCYSSEFWVSIPFWFLIMFAISPNIYTQTKNEETVSSEEKLEEGTN